MGAGASVWAAETEAGLYKAERDCVLQALRSQMKDRGHHVGHFRP